MALVHGRISKTIYYCEYYNSISRRKADLRRQSSTWRSVVHPRREVKNYAQQLARRQQRRPSCLPYTSTNRSPSFPASPRPRAAIHLEHWSSNGQGFTKLEPKELTEYLSVSQRASPRGRIEKLPKWRRVVAMRLGQRQTRDWGNRVRERVV